MSGYAEEPDEGEDALPDAGPAPAGNAGSVPGDVRDPASGSAARPTASADRRGTGGPHRDHRGPVYGALDLGTNNCRLLLARPSRRGFRVVDAFSRIIRLGEGVSHTGRLSDAAMQRTIEALRICAAKIERAGTHRARLVATEACRSAANGGDFLRRVKGETGLDIEVLTPAEEAILAVAGCASLIDTTVDYALVFDIGGGSSELIWLDLRRVSGGGPHSVARIVDNVRRRSGHAVWTSLPVGVVTLAERFGGREVTSELFEAMVAYVAEHIAPFERRHNFRGRIAGSAIHFLGTSGTVTTVAGIQLGLPRYDRNKVDGCWMKVSDVNRVTYDLLARSYAERVAEPCIGHDRADLVLAGCAILEAIIRAWPCERLRVADRGLREGILSSLMMDDNTFRTGRRRRRGE